MNDTKFSVLLSLYYKENPKSLNESLCSILNQTLPANEIVIVKDGPLTEELEQVLDLFSKQNEKLKIVTLPQNQGLGKALNEGLKHCSHNLVARMDTDDIAKPERFAKQIKIFQDNPNIDVCSSWIEEFEDSPENILAIKKLPEHHMDIVKYAKHRCPINHPAVMYKKESVLKVGGYTGFPEDYCLWIKMLMNGAKFYNMQESLLYFRFSRDVIKRRGGWEYAKADVKSQFSFYKMGFISIVTLVYNILIRVSVRLIPYSLRSYTYRKLLRNNGQN